MWVLLERRGKCSYRGPTLTAPWQLTTINRTVLWSRLTSYPICSRTVHNSLFMFLFPILMLHRAPSKTIFSLKFVSKNQIVHSVRLTWFLTGLCVLVDIQDRQSCTLGYFMKYFFHFECENQTPASKCFLKLVLQLYNYSIKRVLLA